ncbi:MAG: DUF3307 domain-containing protein [Pseudomonadales bacterium]|nr:DUF3307 domain-containing protein [Pseudomonadales bacterium]NIX06679.1 DUF3307 domain-containing protein [Pseudomonadales bacterium]
MPETLFLLIAGHAICDFVLQSEAMATGKNHRLKERMRERHGPSFPTWPYWLISHAITHGTAVFLITGNLMLGLLETVLHLVIDYTKCAGRISLLTDQILHGACKVGYVSYLAYASTLN